MGSSGCVKSLHLQTSDDGGAVFYQHFGGRLGSQPLVCSLRDDRVTWGLPLDCVGTGGRWKWKSTSALEELQNRAVVLDHQGLCQGEVLSGRP